MQPTAWQPKSAGIAVCAVFGLVMAVAAATVVTDPPGRLLAGVAAVGLLSFAALSWRARPKLVVAPSGLVIRGWLRSAELPPAQVALVRITEFRRIGRKVRLLEIDTTDDQLFVLSRWDLGTDPLEVLDSLTAAGYAPAVGRRDS